MSTCSQHHQSSVRVHKQNIISKTPIRTQKGKSKYRICADTNNNPVYSSHIPYILNFAVFQLRPSYTTGSGDPIFRKGRGKGKATRMCIIIMSFKPSKRSKAKRKMGCCVNYLSIFPSTPTQSLSNQFLPFPTRHIPINRDVLLCVLLHHSMWLAAAVTNGRGGIMQC